MLCHLFRGDGLPCNTMSPGTRPTSIPSDIFIHPVVWPQQTWAENWGAVPFFEELGPYLTLCGVGRGQPPCRVSPGSIQPFGHNRQGPKFGVLCPHFWGAGSPSSTMSPGPGPGPRPTSIPSGILIHPAAWPQHTWAENWGIGAVPLLGRGAGSPSNTMWPGPRPTSMPSFILIHPIVCAQYTSVTDRQTDIHTDNGPIA